MSQVPFGHLGQHRDINNAKTSVVGIAHNDEDEF